VEVLEHLRIAQWTFWTSHAIPTTSIFPGRGYWPATAAPPDEKAWDKACAPSAATSRQFPISWPIRQRIFTRRFPTAAGRRSERSATGSDHNAYHLGEMVLLRGSWALGKSDSARVSVSVSVSASVSASAVRCIEHTRTHTHTRTACYFSTTLSSRVPASP